MSELTLSVVIPTYNREQVLINTIEYLLAQARDCTGFEEIIVVDQTRAHDEGTQQALDHWHETGAIRRICLAKPNLTGAMNTGLLEAGTDLVLYVDDDIIPGENLLINHIRAHRERADVAAVVGQVLQPDEKPESLEYQPRGSHLRRYMDFPFRSSIGTYIENAMAGNLCVKRDIAIAVGGFDENFTPPVASRFESEFAKRLTAHGHRIWFEPLAPIDHLAARSGGTRSSGNFLRSGSPIYGQGDFYFALLHGRGLDRLLYILYRPIRSVATRFHLKNPWWIPVKFAGEIRAFWSAYKLKRRGQRLLANIAGDDIQ